MNWYNFYKDRVNSDYQDYFEKQYKPFLEFILSFKPGFVVDAGCGIGSVSKYLMANGVKCSGFDVERKMLQLARENCKSGDFYYGDLLWPGPKVSSKAEYLHVTHGVLEHFTDAQIMQILLYFPNSIHYVPLDKYHEPSFGDERLLSKEYWIDLVKPELSFTFNNGHDLCFKT